MRGATDVFFMDFGRLPGITLTPYLLPELISEVQKCPQIVTNGALGGPGEVQGEPGASKSRARSEDANKRGKVN